MDEFPSISFVVYEKGFFLFSLQEDATEFDLVDSPGCIFFLNTKMSQNQISTNGNIFPEMLTKLSILGYENTCEILYLQECPIGHVRDFIIHRYLIKLFSN